MAEPLRISFRYRGRDVDSGTMPVDEVIDALQGFSGAYGKVASRMSAQARYELRVSAITPGSFDMLILAAVYLAQNQDQLKALEAFGHVAKYVFGLIANVIRAKKHTKGLPYNVAVKGDGNTTVLINADNVDMTIPPEAIDLFREKLLDSDLNKIVAPLRPGSIESAEITADDGSGEPIEASINSEEREFFRPISLESSKEIEIVGTLVSLNKETSRGTFKFGNNASVRYHYVGDNPDSFHADFAYKGPVRVTCTAHFDENLTPVQLDIKSVKRLQPELGFGGTALQV
jgi:hypothetical protein